MDNLTHTLIGLVAGDSVSRATRTRADGLTADQRRTGLVAIAAIGGNVPDLDLLYSYQAITGDKLGYLLEHRGYTHTILGCFALALLLYAGAEAWARIRRVTLSPSDRCAFAAMALLGVMLHLGMDALNSYGVHPFWPVNNRWVYGDSVFIIEPLYWLATAPMFFLMRSVAARVVIALVVLGGLAANVFTHSAQPLWCVAVVLATAALLAVGKLTSHRTASFTSAVLMLGVTAMFVFAGQAAAHRAESIAASSFPGEKNIDHVLSPLPSNPFCWDLLLIQTESNEYTVRHGVISTAPLLMPPAACPRIFPNNRGTAPMVRVPVPPSREVEWLGQFSMPIDRLSSLAADNCEAYELLQFARVPYALEVDRRWVIGDLRFDREVALGMSEIALTDPAPARCRYDAPWVPPRDALLNFAR
jgi:inner membrane protein